MFWNFGKEFLNTIQEYCEVPKVKTEILIQIVLKTFIQDVLNEHYGFKERKEKMKYATIEFPYLTMYATPDCKPPIQNRGTSDKDIECKNQTKNIDYLLLTNSKAYFVELKTASESTDKTQMGNYTHFINNLNSDRTRIANLFKSDIEQVKKVTKAKSKYDKLQRLIVNTGIDVSRIDDFEMIYITTSDIKRKYDGKNDIKWLSLTEIAEIQPYKFFNTKYGYWNVVSKILKSIDT